MTLHTKYEHVAQLSFMIRSFIGNESNSIKDAVKDRSKIDVIWLS